MVKQIFLCCMLMCLSLMALASTNSEGNLYQDKSVSFDVQNVQSLDSAALDTPELKAEGKTYIAPAIITCRPGPIPGSPTPRLCNNIESEIQTANVQHAHLTGNRMQS